MNNNFLLIGIDGGATKVSGWSIVVEGENTFSFGELHAEKLYSEIGGYIENFTPVNITEQLAEFQNSDIQLTAEEIQHGKTYIEATAQVIEQIVAKSSVKKVLIGIGMPGLKTEDIRGIAVMANGPRMIYYCRDLENRLAGSEIQFVSPIAGLGSDASYCGIGEEYAKDGQFRNVMNSYYLGGGTGVADALKLDGSLVQLDDIKDWFAKAWEMKSEEDYPLEKYASAKGIQSFYSDLSGISLNDLNSNGIYLQQIKDKAIQGEKPALETYKKITYYLALVLYERISTLNVGWQNLFSFVNPNKSKLSGKHPYLGKVFDSIVIGQRLGDLFRSSKGDEIVWKPFFNHLSEMIMKSVVLSEKVKNYYCPDGKFSEDLLQISNLREAPAIGAGIDAYLAWKNK